MFVTDVSIVLAAKVSELALAGLGKGKSSMKPGTG